MKSGVTVTPFKNSRARCIISIDTGDEDIGFLRLVLISKNLKGIWERSIGEK